MVVPLHESADHCHIAPTDKVPVTCSVELLPAQTGVVPLAETGSLGVFATVTLAFTQLEKQVPVSALKKQLVVDEGETEIETPVPAATPPHVSEYQCQLAPTESVPVAVRVDEPAEHKKVGEAIAVKGADGVTFTAIGTLLQFEKHAPFSARTKYVVADKGETVIEVPIPAGVPPQETEYQCQVAPGDKTPVT